MTAQPPLDTPNKSDTMSLPYSPSWLDGLEKWLDRLPIPVWLFYGLLAVISIVGFAAVQWAAGQYPVGTLYPIHIYIMGVGFYMLGLLYYLDRYAHTAFTRFYPALDATPEHEKLFRYQLTTLPARSTWVATIIGLGIGALAFLIPFQEGARLYNYAGTSLSIALYLALYILLWGITSVGVYHTIHQLRVMNFIFTQHTHVSLFHHRPLYAFAWLSAYTTIGLILPFGAILVAPEITNSAGIVQSITLVIFLTIFLLLPFTTFLWPLLGIHRLLVEEKERLLDDNATAMEHTMQEIRQRVRSNELAEIDSLNKVLGTLETESRLLRQISTWPWQPGALQSVIAAILLPVGISLIQRVLLRFAP